jgi:hypothetical protein
VCKGLRSPEEVALPAIQAQRFVRSLDSFPESYTLLLLLLSRFSDACPLEALWSMSMVNVLQELGTCFAADCESGCVSAGFLRRLMPLSESVQIIPAPVKHAVSEVVEANLS